MFLPGERCEERVPLKCAMMFQNSSGTFWQQRELITGVVFVTLFLGIQEMPAFFFFFSILKLSHLFFPSMLKVGSYWDLPVIH